MPNAEMAHPQIGNATADGIITIAEPRPAITLDNYVRRDDHVQVWALFGVLIAVLVAAAVAIAATVHDGAWLWAMSLVGAVIITALISAAVVPHLQQVRRASQL